MEFLNSAVAGLHDGWDIKAAIAMTAIPISLGSLIVANAAFRAVRRQEEAKKEETRPVVNLIKHPLTKWPVGYVCLQVEIRNKSEIMLELGSLSIMSPSNVYMQKISTYSHYEMPMAQEVAQARFARKIELSSNVAPKGTVENWPPGDQTPQDRTSVFLALKYEGKRTTSFKDRDVRILLTYRQGLERRGQRDSVTRIEKRFWQDRPPAPPPVKYTIVPS